MRARQKTKGYKDYLKTKKRRRSKRKKTIFKNRYFWITLAGLLILGGLLYFFIFSPVFKIKAVTAEGASLVDKLEIEALAEEMAKNILFFPSRQTQKLILEEFLPVEEAIIKREFPDKLKIIIKERVPVLLFCQEQELNEQKEEEQEKQEEREKRPKEKTCFLTDKNGLAFFYLGGEEEKQDFELLVRGLPFVVQDKEEKTLGEKVLESETVAFIFKLDKTIKDYPRIKIKNFSVDLPKITIKTEQGWEIYFSQDKDLKTQKEDLILVLEKEIFIQEQDEISNVQFFAVGIQSETQAPEDIDLDYIDLRFDQLLYKYRE
jgi:hypothetical protein